MNGVSKTHTSERMPGLDGMRALAIAGVIVYHLVVATPNHSSIVRGIANRGEFGVTAFFVLSGFLITLLLMGEEERNGRINSVLFYYRRSLRILPPAFAFLAVVGILSLFQLVSISMRELAEAGTFVRNYFGESPVVDAHFWSLAVEEQFYLLWPAFLILVPRRARLPVAGALVAFSPAWNWLCYTRLSHGADLNHWRFDLVCDRLLVGSLLAMVLRTPRGFSVLHNPVFRSRWIIPFSVAALVVLLSPNLLRGPSIVRAPCLTLSCILVAVIINRLIIGGHDLVDGVLNHPSIVWVGRLSYSLYLWQQLFCMRVLHVDFLCRFPINVIATFVCASISYYFVEQPALRLRGTLQKGFVRRMEKDTTGNVGIEGRAGVPAIATPLTLDAAGFNPSEAG